MLILKRNAQEVAAGIVAIIAVLASQLDWDAEPVAYAVAAVFAAATFVQYLNVVGTDQFTTAAVGLAGALMTLAVGLGLDGLSDDTQTAVLSAIPIVLGLLIRNGVTNKNTPAGQAALAA